MPSGQATITGLLFMSMILRIFLFWPLRKRPAASCSTLEPKVGFAPRTLRLPSAVAWDLAAKPSPWKRPNSLKLWACQRWQITGPPIANHRVKKRVACWVGNQSISTFWARWPAPWLNSGGRRENQVQTLHRAPNPALSVAHFRAATRPHRHSHRSAALIFGRVDGKAHGRELVHRAPPGAGRALSANRSHGGQFSQL